MIRYFNIYTLVHSLLSVTVDMSSKMSSRYPDIDGNWQWPEKTWFRERLNALKAQENEQRRKPVINSKAPTHDAPSEHTDKAALKAE